MFKKVRKYLFAIASVLCLLLASNAQTTTSSGPARKGRNTSSSVAKDSARKDSIRIDSLKLRRNKNADFKSKIVYSAKDSLMYSADQKTAYLYGDAKITYEDIELTAAFIQYDFTTNIVRALPLKDSVGNDIGIPSFKQGDQSFTSSSMSYNFKTKQGIIYKIYTKQNDGFLHAEKTKRHEDGSVDLWHGIYTTCDLPHPHYGIVLTRGKVLPNDKIVSGPAYLEFEDVPLPIFLPFGFFPNSHKSSVSGIVIPAYGESASEGFYLRDGGYYFALSDYFDLAVKGSIWSKGNWGTTVQSTYKKNYKYTGNFNFNYNITKRGIIGIDSGANQFFKQNYLNINWTHSQLPTANPNQTFSANVNYSSSGYDRRYNYYGYNGINNILQTTKSSSISYGRKFSNSNLSVNLRHDQNNQTGIVNLTLPVVRFDATKIYLFRRKNTTGEPKWYDNIFLNYNSEMSNIIRANENQVFSPQSFRNAQNGFQHGTSFATNIKFLKYFNFSPSIGYQGRIYTKQFRRIESFKKRYSDADSVNGKNQRVWYYYNDTIRKLSYAHAFSPSANLSFNPTIYGMMQFGPKSKIYAIRHVMTPSFGVNFVPGIKELVPNYYRNYRTSDTTYGTYSIYDGNLYGTPTGSSRSAGISLNIGNNVEMKVKSAKDTLTGLKKIVLIQSLNFSASYNPYAQTRKLSTIGINGTSPILKGLTINYNATLDPYGLDSLGRGTNTYYWKNHKGIGRITGASLSFGYTFQSGGGNQPTNQATQTAPGTLPGPNQTGPGGTQTGAPQQPQKPAEDFTYFKIPWSFSFNYGLTYTKPGFEKNILQNLTFNGNFGLGKWAVSFTSGYDFKAKGFTPTSVVINRDLHCFTMNISFIPFGPFRYYEFRINAVSQLLQDLKYDQRRDYYDNPEYRGYGF